MIDYLCIDQMNLAERNHQVAMMSQIYARAETVIVWLGLLSEGSDTIMGYLDEVSGARSKVELECLIYRY